MKRRIALLLSLALLCSVCAGCRMMNAVSKKDADPTAVEADAQNGAENGGPAFRLEELPDIGSYETKQAESFYDAPLDEFREADNYGEIIPYYMTSNGEVGSCGFMTADGKLITAPIYSSIYTLNGREKTVYAAELKAYYENADADWESVRGNYPDDVKCQMIKSDGSKCVTVTQVTPSDHNSSNMSEPLIVCRILGLDGGFMGDTCEFYDFDLNKLGSLTGSSYVNASFVDHKDGTVTFSAYAGESGNSFFTWKDGTVTNLGLKSDGYNDYLGGGMYRTDDAVYSMDGKTVCALGDGGDALYDRESGSLFVYDPQENTLRRLENGTVTASVSPEAGGDLNCELYKYDSAGQPCLCLAGCLPGSYVERYFEFFDMQLRKIRTVVCGEEGKGRLGGSEVYGEAETWLAVLRETTVEIYSDVSMEPVVLELALDVQRSYPYSRNGVITLNDASGCYYLQAKNALLTSADGYAERENAQVALCCETCYVVGVPAPGNKTVGWDSPVLTYRIYDTKTDRLLYDGVSDFTLFSVNGKDYLNFSYSGMTYVCDGELNVIAAIPDGYYA